MQRLRRLPGSRSRLNGLGDARRDNIYPETRLGVSLLSVPGRVCAPADILFSEQTVRVFRAYQLSIAITVDL